MACDVSARECLYCHVRPKLDGAGEIRLDDETGRPYFLAQCPAHDDQKRSLKISEGKQRHLVWICYAGCSEGSVRHALIERGIHPGCLPRAAAELRDLEEAMRALLTSDLSHADVRLHALALLDSPGGRLPSGAALVRLAAAVHVSRSGASEARRGGTSRTTK